MIKWQAWSMGSGWSAPRSAANLTDLRAKINKAIKKKEAIYIYGNRNTLSIKSWESGKVFIGCISKTRDQWLKMSERWSKSKGYDTKTRKEYERYVKLLSSIKFK